MDDAEVPLNFTSVTGVNPDPLIVTTVPTGPELGENELIVVVAVTVNDEAEVPVPREVVTVMAPVVVPAGTVAVIWVSLITVNTEIDPKNFTAVAPVNPVPLIVTNVPTGPEAGEKFEITGAALTVNIVEDSPFPRGVLTRI